jgi:hypothetical protein
MRKYLLLLVLFYFTSSCLFNPLTAQVDISGGSTANGSYTTLAAAVTALNGSVISGPVVIDVDAGHTEDIGSSPILLTATGTAVNTITFQKDGMGANPVISRSDAGSLATSTGGGQGDAIIIIEGGDYITFNGIDVSSSSGTIEYGYYLRKASVTNAPKNITIQNATVDMTKGTTAFVFGIAITNNDAASTVSSATGITVTSTGGRTENVSILGCTITDVHYTVYARGFNHNTAPYDFQDQNLVVGAMGSGNTLTNFGGGSTTASYGVYMIYQAGATIAYNTVTGAGTHTGTHYAIFASTNYNGNLTVNNNTIQLTTAGTTNTIAGIYCSAGTTGHSSNTQNLHNNTITINRTTATSGATYFIYSTANGPNNFTAEDNIIGGTGSSLTGTGVVYGIGQISTPNNVLIDGNTVQNITRTSATSTSALYGIYQSNSNATAESNISNNIIHTLAGNGSSGIIAGISGATFSGPANRIHANRIYNISSATASGLAYGIHLTSGVANYVYNNMISDIKSPSATSTGADAVRGISITNTAASSSNHVYFNSIYLDGTSSGTNFYSSGIFHTYSATSTSGTLYAYNNIIVNNATPTGTGIASAIRRSAATDLNNIDGFKNNCLYAGTPSANNLIYYDGTNSDQTFAAYATRLGAKENSSFSENAPFVNTGSTPYDLKINTATPTQIESGGIVIATPINITTDFEGNARNGSTPDIGADEFAGTGLDLLGPSLVYTALGNTTSTSNRTLVVTITDASGVAGGANAPRIYYRKAGGSYFASNATSIAGNDYTFTIDYANVSGGSVSGGDDIEYYFAAQDLAGTPNVSTSPTGGSGINPPGTTPPVTPATYRIAQTYTWQGATNDYTDPANWSPARSSIHPSDRLIFDGMVTPTTSANSIPVQTIAYLAFVNNVDATLNAATAGNDLTVNATSTETAILVETGSTVNFGTTTSIDIIHGTNLNQVSTVNGLLVLANTSTMNLLNAVTTVTGVLRNSSTATTPLASATSSSLIFTTGTYHHNRNGTGVPTAATYQTGSTFLVTGITTTVLTPPATVGHFTWNCTAQTGTNLSLGSAMTTINGNFTVESTGTGSFRMGVGTSTHTITGNFVMNGGNFQVTGSTNIIQVNGNATVNNGATLDLSASASNGTFRVMGSLTIAAGGTLTESSTSTGSVVTLNGTTTQAVDIAGTVSNNVNWRLENNAGITITGTLPVNNACTFTNASTATTPVTGTIFYNATASTLAYNTSTAQTSTNGDWPSTDGPVSVTLNNTAGVTLHAPRTVTGALTFTNGALTINNHTLTLNGTVASMTAAKSIVSGGSASIVIGGTGAFGTIFFSQTTDGTTNTVQNFTYNRTSGTLTLGNKLIISGLLNVTAGTLNTGGFPVLRSSSISGTAQVGEVGGSISGSVQVERFIPGKRSFRLLASGVTSSGTIKSNWQEGATSNVSNPNVGFGTHITGNTVDQTNGFDGTVTGNASLHTFDAVAQTYTAIANTNVLTLNSGTGYRLLVRGSRAADLSNNNATADNTVLRATGTLTTGSVSYTTMSSPALASAVDAYSLVGNPYWAQVDWHALSKTDITDAYWIWDPTRSGTYGRGAFVSYSQTSGMTSDGSSGMSRYLQPGQAFFIKNTSSAVAPALGFAEANKAVVQSLTSTFRQQAVLDGKLWVRLYLASNAHQADGHADGVGIAFSTSFSKSVKDHEDVSKLGNTDENLSVLQSGKFLSIAGIALPQTADTLQLSVNNLLSQQYVLQVEGKEFSSDVDAWLLDRYTRTETRVNLTGIVSYSFGIDNNAGSKDAQRFQLLFKKPQATVPVTLSNGLEVSLAPNPASSYVQVSWQNKELGSTVVRVVSMEGQVLYSQSLGMLQSGQIKLPVDRLSKGVYTVELSSGKLKQSVSFVKQ